ncbi:patatin-like phospholipase family protein [Undibacterium sp.]|uniref:patatin-like phospholipase family protein n=1 Tax=Undibacterium sp. TaxID=1914977 RepID=UPI0025F944C2|nr:patatin-like phospholipase family protein [Undibacterium sp.]
MSPFHALTLIFAFSTTLLPPISSAQQLDSELGVTPEQKKRPKIALVLSGGGARGFAHIGVLKVLKDLRIPVDMVVGTSMGAVVGGAYAAGRSVEELEEIVKNTSWESVLADRPARDQLDFRRREEDVILPSRIEFSITKSGVSLPPAAAGNAALEQALTRLLPSGTRDDAIDQLPIPFRSVVSDLVSGELMELSTTPLFQTLRASLAVPGVFAPVHINQRLVVDGGLVRNLPIDMAHKMGADIVIAVNVGTPLAQERELGSAISVAQQMLQILTEQNVQRSLKELRPQDILIAPDLNGISFLDFSQSHKSIQAGDNAAKLLREKLSQFAVTEEEYAVLERNRFAAFTAPDVPLPLATIEVKGTRYINPAALIVQTGLTPGEAVSEEQVRQAAAKLYGRGDLDHVETQVHDSIDQRSVSITASEASWSRNRLRVGIELTSDFSDKNSFSLGAMHIASSLNPWGGELRTVARIGSIRALGSQLFQPLGAGSQWYLAPSVQYGASSFDLYEEGKKNYRVGYQQTSATLVLGKQLGNWGDLQFGLTRQLSQAHVELPEDSEQAPSKVFGTSPFFQFRLDTLDSLAFPTRGQLLTALWQRPQINDDENDGKKSLAQSSIIAMSAFQTGEWAGHLYGEWAKSQRGASAPASLGGFLRLSGTPTDSLSNNTVALGRLVLAHRIGRMPTTLGGAIRAGFSLELGGGFGADDVVKFSNLKQSASAFISLDTRFGPLYFGSGTTRGAGSTLYLFLGPIW